MLKKWWFWTIILLAFLVAFLIGIIILSRIGFNNKIAEKEQQLINLKDENNSIQEQFMGLSEKISTLTPPLLKISTVPKASISSK